MLSTYYYVGILANLVVAIAFVTFQIRQRTWWTLSLLVSYIALVVWFFLDQWAVSANLNPNPTAMERATIQVLEFLGLVPPILIVFVFSVSLLAVALTMPRRIRH